MNKIFGLLFRKKEVGRIGEDLAAKVLKKSGYAILERNYKNPKGYCIGEIDIVARDGKEIVFVEVKARKCSNVTDVLPPEMNITPSKLHKLERIAQEYLRQRGLADCAYRFDAFAITIDTPSGINEIRHIKHMFL